MKCVRCGHDSKYKERTDRTCPNCKGKFAFEPQARDPVTDMLFKNAVEAVSGGGRLRWGVEHLYYEVCRRARRQAAPLGCVFLTLGVSTFLFALGSRLDHKGETAYFFGAFFGMLTLALALSRIRDTFPKIDQSTFNQLWGRWREVHGTPKGVIERVPDPPAPKDLEADIGDYSFDRAVICDRARTVDLLVSSN